MARMTWNEKLKSAKGLPKVEFIGDDPKAAERFGGMYMLIAPPIEYNELMKKVPPGKLVTTSELRSALAKKHGADFTCPLTCGIFVNIVANASREREILGQGDIVPYWRTLKKDGELCEKFPGGLEGHRILLESEGFTVVKKGKRYFVKDYEESLADIENI